MRDIWTSPLPNGVQVSLRRNTSFPPFVGVQSAVIIFSPNERTVYSFGDPSLEGLVYGYISLSEGSPNEYSKFFLSGYKVITTICTSQREDRLPSLWYLDAVWQNWLANFSYFLYFILIFVRPTQVRAIFKNKK